MKDSYTGIVGLEKTKLTPKEVEFVKMAREGIEIRENETYIIVHSLDRSNHKFMSRMVDLLYKTAKR